MNRKTKLFINVLSGIIQKIVLIICGFIVPRYMLVTFGSSINGLVSSINHFLGFISLLELGIGSVITANLYEPLAKNNKEQLSRVIISAERFFRKIAVIFSIYVFILVFIYPKYLKTDYDFLFTSSLLLIISISTFANYFLGITYNLLLNADQKAYIPILLGITATVLNTIFIVVGVQLGFSIHKIILFSTVAHLLKPIGQYLYVHKNYDIDKTLNLNDEPIKQKWNGFAQHLSSVVGQHIDVVALSCFSALANVSIYHIYYLVTSGITSLAMTGTSGIEALFGNLLANNEKEKLIKFFSIVELFFHNVLTILFTTTALTIVPFVLVYTKGIKDADYNVPLFACLIVGAYYFRCLRIPYFLMIRAAGHFKQIQNDSFISMGLNVVITLLVVKYYGLSGVALGTLISMLYLTLYFAWYLSKNIICRPVKHFVNYLLTDIITVSVIYYFTKSISMTEITYYAWAIMACKVFSVALAISAIFNFVFYNKLLKQGVNYIFKKNNLKQ